MMEIQVVDPAGPYGRMARFTAFAFGCVSYFTFPITFMYALGFASAFAASKTIDLVACWTAPVMIDGRFLFAAVSTGYILVGMVLRSEIKAAFFQSAPPLPGALFDAAGLAHAD